MDDCDIYIKYGALMLAVIRYSVSGKVKSRPRPDIGDRRDFALKWEIYCRKIMGVRRWTRSRMEKFEEEAKRIEGEFSWLRSEPLT